MRHLLFTLTAAAALLALSPAIDSKPAHADDYWDGYWSWYDGTYRPYVTRRYYSTPYEYGYAVPYPGPSYYGPSYRYLPGDYYYGRRYYGDYYGTPNVGYYDFPGGGQVRVGPLRFGWR